MKKLSVLTAAVGIALFSTSVLSTFTSCKSETETEQTNQTNSQKSSERSSESDSNSSSDDSSENSTEDSTQTEQIFDINNYSKTNEVYAIPKGETVTITITDDSSWNVYCDENSSDEYKGIYTSGRNVKLNSFLISQYQVTQELYKAIMGENVSFCYASNAAYGEVQKYRPAECVSWFEAIAFCNKLSEKMGYDCVYSYDFSSDGSKVMTNPDDWLADSVHLSSTFPTNSSDTNYKNWNKVKIDLSKNGYRLPTEAEWEFAARGGDAGADDWKFAYAGRQCTKTIYCLSIEEIYNSEDFTGILKEVNVVDKNLEQVAWYYKGEYTDDKTHEVGCIANGANSLGLYDMSGNVFEWCNDFYDADVDSAAATYLDAENYEVNPAGPATGTNRVRRGGGWYGSAYECSVSYRGFAVPYMKNSLCGIRLVRSDWD